MICRAKVVLLFAMAAVILAGCSDPDPPVTTNVDRPSTAPVQLSDAPCRPEFEAIAAQLARVEGGFFEQNRADKLRQTRSGMGGDLGKMLGVTYQLVRQLLQDGATEEAVREVDIMFRALESRPDVLEKNPSLHLLRGLAYLRLAEIENCVKRHNAECCLFPLQNGGVHEVKQPAREARSSYLNYLSLEPSDLRARWLLNLASMAIGDYPDAVPAELLIPTSWLDAKTDIKRFPDIAPRLGIDKLDLCGGCIVDDFDGDGDLDIATSTIDPLGSMAYFRNEGDGSFIDASSQSRLDDQLGGLNIIGADYDNDGDVDILVLRGAWLFDEGQIRNSLLRNDGQGRFTDVTRFAGTALPARPTQAAAWGDFDNDGDLDLYVGNESRADTSKFPADQAAGGDYPAQLFLNQGDGTFKDAAKSARVTNDRYCKGVAVGDYDNDGDLDIYVSNIGRNRLYRNENNGTFIDVAPALGVTEPADRSFVPWFFDYDNDGWLDLFVAGYDAGVDDVAARYLGRLNDATSPCLYQNRGGRFKEVAASVGFDRPLLPMGANFGDLDNDGFLDVYIGTGDPDYETIMPNVMLRNANGQRFEDVSRSGGFGHLQKGHGIAFADIDNDGDQDLYHQIGGFFAGDAYHNALFENPGHGNHFLTMRLVGTRSPRNGFGARITVEVDTPEGTRSIHRAVGSVSSFGGSTSRQEIGLGNATGISQVTIFWPGSGTTQVLKGVPMNAMIEVREGEASFKPVPLEPIELGQEPRSSQ